MSDLHRYARELGSADVLEIELPRGYGEKPQTLTWNGRVFVGPQGCEWEPEELLWKFMFAHECAAMAEKHQPDEPKHGEPEYWLHPWEFIFGQLLCDGHLRPRCNGVRVR